MLKEKKRGGMGAGQFWLAVWGMGLAGQLCWNMENQWFNTFVYAKISGDVSIVTWMVMVSALVTTLSTFLFGTLSDRLGRRKIFVSVGYIIWGATTILFGLTEYARNSGIGALLALSGFLVVLTDAVMSFFGSMGCDAGYSVWLNDYTHDSNRGQVGAALAVLPVIGTVVGTVVGGALINIGNPAVGTPNYDPSLDNYQLLFWTMGLFVILMGVLSLFLMRDVPTLRPSVQGTFRQQFLSGFRFKKLNANPNFKELLLACGVVCAFFVPFNFYFVHMGNWLIYDIGFTTGDMGLVEGIALLFAALVTIPFAGQINGNKTPRVALIGTLTNAVGLVLTFFFIKSPESVNTEALLSVENLPVFLCVFLIGVGYVLMTQAGNMWIKGLFPEESKGQLEGLRVVAFTLIPMLLGTSIGNLIIKNTPQPTPQYDVYGHVIDVPQENLFLIAGIMVLVTLVPLWFGAKAYNRRIAAQGK